MRWNVVHLVHCGGAAEGVEAPQYKPFYTVPFERPLCTYVFKRKSFIEERVQRFSVNFRLKFPLLVGHQVHLQKGNTKIKLE